ncbi:GNAT family acetyltransferase [Methanosarcina sp. 2.H.T.1A.6]|uniref:putative beta-lysine N-acetyltransferase n=1 Tax=unclassified Methanosarcina TaxID=2644672 RepID=UPI000621092B|nr:MULTISPECIES: putative beta-lysine N-acetyltransferase [unclassified Methanosarcina]KKG14278.1 GNAT family acetyltransferase [Methanosarcina sp. 2.H.T.1A.3]KKG16951.1 GNAT family acetyltransferase [Methanosarcina sp. 2.H.T.1A.15]KKG19768.1 GNAT family acetyltransferase [Methanosarcina sp. 2.H.T.1A.6]KKG27155.1 GNAT family acetyltransferase [Methanosarcina sp. 2.H.T.1A.8]
MSGARAELVIDYYNRRIKVMDFAGLFEEISGTLEALAEAEEMGKIIVYTPPEKGHEPKTCGYAEEGIIRGYYAGKDCHIFSSYPKNSRGISFHKEIEDQVIKNCLRKSRGAGKNPHKLGDSRKKKSWKIQKENIRLPEEYTLRPAVQADASAMAILYSQGFQFYPTPLHMESYLLKTMDSNVLYFLVEKQGEIVSLASAEMDSETGSAEITDCLTVPSERGKGLIKELITALEKELSYRNFLSSYTLCRASSPGINAAFASQGYAYTGRLVNNCRIEKGFEDMNIWCKRLK